MTTSVLALRAEAFPVRFSGTQPNGEKTDYYADLNHRSGNMTQTKASNRNINAPAASPGHRYPNGFVDNLVQIAPQPFTKFVFNRDFMSTENLPIINNINEISADQRYIPSPDGQGYQLLKKDGSNALPGAEVFRGRVDPSTGQFKVTERTKILISGTDPQRGTIFIQMPR